MMKSKLSISDQINHMKTYKVKRAFTTAKSDQSRQKVISVILRRTTSSGDSIIAVPKRYTKNL